MPMYNPTVIGVDPGLVHTGIVMLDFEIERRELRIDHAVVDGLAANEARAKCALMTAKPLSICVTYIEKYTPRSGFGVDEQMVQANADFSRELQGFLLRNTGVKKVVTQELMELCHCWKFPSKTHHQDLRSAARIALLGMMLDDTLNQVLYAYVTDSIDGRKWNVTVK